MVSVVVWIMAPGSRRPTAPGTERCHRWRMTPVMQQRAVRHAVVSSGLRCVADQCGAVDRDNEILAPDGDDCSTGCDGQRSHLRLRCRVDHEHRTDLTAGGAAAYGERALVGTQFPGALELRTGRGVPRGYVVGQRQWVSIETAVRGIGAGEVDIGPARVARLVSGLEL